MKSLWPEKVHAASETPTAATTPQSQDKTKILEDSMRTRSIITAVVVVTG
jgi:hypothetical protein